MCHNIIDGRYHAQCCHFVELASRPMDCGRQNCLFSSRHAHPIGCRNSSCIRLMNPPVKNPIRMSPAPCPNCTHLKNLGGPIGQPPAVRTAQPASAK
ncbi:hypothetical protein BKA70DRAFT_1416593 [Coprinopsis sp. MPI-PUGE-AT-0042]|nr:hypothetical protein BKA70DRAFT_1416593 [Coprinopsis sp. MPI-PUGE-AT-0042]